MNKTILAISLGFLCFQVTSIVSMEPEDADDARKKQREHIEAQLLEAWKASGMTLRVMQRDEGEKQEEQRKEPKGSVDECEEERVRMEAELFKLSETGKEVRMALRSTQDGQVEKTQETTVTKEQGAPIAVCLMRAPSSMHIPKKPN